MAGYVSDITQFIRKLKAEDPAIEADQARGRRIYWDKAPIDLHQRDRDIKATIAQKPYPYQTDRAAPNVEQETQ